MKIYDEYPNILRYVQCKIQRENFQHQPGESSMLRLIRRTVLGEDVDNLRFELGVENITGHKLFYTCSTHTDTVIHTHTHT